MKKILKGVCMLALVAMAFTSCKKNENKAHTFYATSEELVVSNVDRAYIVYQGNSASTDFEAGDQIMMYNLNYSDPRQTYYGVYTARTTGHTVPYDYQSGPIIDHMSKQDAFFGYYPGQRVNNAYLADRNVVVFNIPNYQNYREINGVAAPAERSMAMAAKYETDDPVATIDDADLQFKNIMGVLRLDLRSNTPRTVKSIVFEDKKFNITGDVHLRIDKVDDTRLLSLINRFSANYDTNPSYMAELNDCINDLGYFVDGEKGNTITLNCGEGVQINGTAKPFYIALRPAAYYAGCIITINFEEGEPAVINSSRNNMFKPNDLKVMPLLVDNYIP